MLAVYDGEKLTEIKILSPESYVFEAYDTQEFNISAYTDKTYKLFFWSDSGNAEPYCTAYSNN